MGEFHMLRCDSCGREASIDDGVGEWFKVERRDPHYHETAWFYSDEEKKFQRHPASSPTDFCSLECLAAWSSAQWQLLQHIRNKAMA